MRIRFNPIVTRGNPMPYELEDDETAKSFPKTMDTQTQIEAIEATPEELKMKTEQELQRIAAELRDLKQTIELRLVDPQQQSVDGLDLHMGEPTPEQLSKINALTGMKGEAADWFVCAFHASDNLVDRSRSRWHLNVLQQMASSQTGRVLMTDHNSRQVSAAIGFAFDTKLLVDENPDDAIVDTTYSGFNRQIVDEMGLVKMIVWCAIPSDKQIARDLQMRVADNCSTGGLMPQYKEICPNCSRAKGYDVSFWEVNDEGRYLCSHLPPDWFWLWIYGDDPDIEFADYTIIDGVYESVELSVVQTGCLPAAKVLRERQF